jgi:hypothetical protein
MLVDTICCKVVAQLAPATQHADTATLWTLRAVLAFLPVVISLFVIGFLIIDRAKTARTRRTAHKFDNWVVWLVVEGLLVLCIVVPVFVISFPNHGRGGTHFVSLLAVVGLAAGLAGIYFASRADQSASRAFNKAEETHLAYTYFANELKDFMNKVTHYLDTDVPKGGIAIRFMTVIPAFGAVGEKGDPFSTNLLDRVEKTDGWYMEMLTYRGEDVAEWLGDIIRVSVRGEPDGIVSVVEQGYASQQRFVGELASRLAEKKGEVRFWDKTRFNSPACPVSGDDATSAPRARPGDAEARRTVRKMPFQMLVVARVVDKKSDPDGATEAQPKEYDPLRVFFLFSADFLYDFVLRELAPDKWPSDMSMLSRLTKGYFLDERETVKFFNAVFTTFWDRMGEKTDKLGRTKAEVRAHFPEFAEFKQAVKCGVESSPEVAATRVVAGRASDAGKTVS